MAFNSAKSGTLAFRGEGSLVTLDAGRLVGNHLFIPGQTGAGKSYALRRTVEVAHSSGLPAILVDSEGEFHTLAAFDPDRFIVIGGPKGQLPLVPETVGDMVPTIVASRNSVVIDLSEHAPEERTAVVASVCKVLLDLPEAERKPVLLCIDEIQLFAPQMGNPESKPALEMVATRGRKRGICLVAATQRYPGVAKSVVTQCSHALLGRTANRAESASLGESFGLPAAPRARLPLLERGEFFAMGTAFGIEPAFVQIAPTVTKHGGNVDLRAILASPATPARETIKRLEGLTEGQTPALVADSEAASQKRPRAEAHAGTPVAPSVCQSQLSDSGSGRASGVDSDDLSQAMLEVLGRSPKGQLSREALGLLVQAPANGHVFEPALGALVAAKLVKRGSKTVTVTALGWEALDQPGPVVETHLMAAELRARLPADHARVLDVLLAAAPTTLRKATIAERCGMSPRSRKLGPILRSLSRRALVIKRGEDYQVHRALVELVRG